MIHKKPIHSPSQTLLQLDTANSFSFSSWITYSRYWLRFWRNFFDGTYNSNNIFMNSFLLHPFFYLADWFKPRGTANILQALGWEPPTEGSGAGRREDAALWVTFLSSFATARLHILFWGDKRPYLCKLMVDLHCVNWSKKPSSLICLLIFILLTRTVHQKVRLLAESPGTEMPLDSLFLWESAGCSI